MKSSPQLSVKISAGTSAGKATKLGKAQAKFNKLVKKIEQQKATLRQWQVVLPQLMQQQETKIKPLQEQLFGLQEQMVVLLDQAYPKKIFGKKDKEKLANVISDVSGSLLEHKDLPHIKEIFNSYNEYDFDQQSQDMEAQLKEMMKQTMGIDLEGKLDLRNPAEILRQIVEETQQSLQAEATEEQRLEEEVGSSAKKSAKQLAKEKQQEQAEKEVSQSLREVYRKLASALHPDREPDEAERKRKTDLMQRVNVAYDAQDLLQLLELQLEIEQIDQATIAAMSETKLKHYIKILEEQSGELAMENEMHAVQYTMHFQPESPYGHTPSSALKESEEKIVQLGEYIQSLQQDLAQFTDLKAIKAWLKTVAYEAPSDFWNDDDDFWLDR